MILGGPRGCLLNSTISDEVTVRFRLLPPHSIAVKPGGIRPRTLNPIFVGSTPTAVANLRGMV